MDFEENIIVVLYKTTSKQHLNQYIQIQRMFPCVSFRSEREVSADFLNVVMNSEFIMFLCDDTIFVRKFRFLDMITTLKENLDCIGFSLRLGRNISYCYPYATTYKETPNFVELTNELLKFDWTHQIYDFGYPMELSSSIYRSSDILELSGGVKYSSLHNVESSLDNRKIQMIEDKPMLLCFSVSHAFSNPINLTSGISGNRVGSDTRYSVNSLADKFDEGWKIDVVALEDFTSIACHQEVPLSFIER